MTHAAREIGIEEEESGDATSFEGGVVALAKSLVGRHRLEEGHPAVVLEAAGHLGEAYALGYLFIVATVLHPSMRKVTEPLPAAAAAPTCSGSRASSSSVPPSTYSMTM